MTDYDDGAYYEVQLNNKQLVFFFMAALAIAVVVFLCGVMVGRGVRDATLAASGGDINVVARPGLQDDGARKVPGAPRFDYAERLERNEVSATLESSSPERPSVPEPRVRPAVAKPAPAAPLPAPAVQRVAAEPPPPNSPALLGADSGPFTIQVVALKTEDAARKLLSKLQGKQYRAYLEAGGEAGLHRVRVGRFQTRAEAETVAQKLRDEEQFRPYITQ